MHISSFVFRHPPRSTSLINLEMQHKWNKQRDKLYTVLYFSKVCIYRTCKCAPKKRAAQMRPVFKSVNVFIPHTVPDTDSSLE